jgi:DNA-binding CsgD family transcriptional regulator
MSANNLTEFDAEVLRQARELMILLPTEVVGDFLIRLTPCELQIAQLLSEGYINKEIAQIRKVSIKTVEFQKQTLFRKCKVKTSAHLVAILMRHKIIV